MEALSIYNNTDLQIFISIFDTDGTEFDKGWLNPLSHFKGNNKINSHFKPGTYRIQSETVDKSTNITCFSLINVIFPSKPIKIETDERGILWWKVYDEKK